MARQLSYSKYEQELRPELRQNMNIAESTEDVKILCLHHSETFRQSTGEERGFYIRRHSA
jgi:hypothetical protein